MAPSQPPVRRPAHGSVSGESAPGDILVVDDDPKNVLAVEVALNELGCTLVKAQSGEQALRLLLARSFALILLDVQMPAMDGFETARIIRSRPLTRHVPIIFLTAFSHNDQDILKGYALGAVDYLFKPIVPEVLRAKAQVFVELQARTAEVARQAEQLREMERLEAARTLEEERQRWEADALRRQMHEQQRINAQLAESDRRKDEFIAILAHELRNPLTPIVTSLELIRGCSTDPMVERARKVMERQTHHLVRLIDDLLDVARITRGKIELHLEDVEIGRAVEQSLETCRPLLEQKGHEVLVSGSSEPLVVRGDAVRLCQIIGNLLSNAARYTDAHGRIEVQWDSRDGSAYVHVRDNGRGIDEAGLDRVFEMFAQATPSGAGLGLGLTLVRQLARLHGGDVSAFSEGPGRGSEFILRIPALSGAPTVRRPVEDSGVVPSAGLRVAVIEDQDDVREMVASLLEHWGHEVSQASSVAEGERLVTEWQPDVALMDIGFPDGDGYTLARRVRAAMGAKTPPLVAITGFGQDHDRRQASDAGFDAHLTKPAKPEELRRLLNQYSRSALGDARLAEE